MKKKRIDLNSDMGEGFGPWTIGDGVDAELMPLISSANIATGFHAGDPNIMRRMVALARELDGPAMVETIERKLPEYLGGGTGDVASGLRHFLLEAGVPETALFVHLRRGGSVPGGRQPPSTVFLF